MKEDDDVVQDCLRLEGMVFYAYHGVLSEEFRLGQRYEVTVAMYLDRTDAGQTDQLSDTINYADVYEEVERVMNGSPVKLIETLAERIAKNVLQSDHIIAKVTVSVRKPNPPVEAFWNGVTLEITRYRDPGALQ